MAESHASMRDDFEITVPQIDTLVEIVKATIGDKGGVRMTGGGFGGCVVALVPEECVGYSLSKPSRSSMKRKPASKRPSTCANRHRGPASAKPNDRPGAGRAAVESDHPAE